MKAQKQQHYCTQIHIETLLELDNCDLLSLCQTHPQGAAGIRKSLVVKQISGYEYLVSANCSNVGTVGECRGHVS